ncbi:hypothetical protein HCA58_23060, partial [Micromonospora sp. HNM0581]|uniref:WXG100-like domain-containing protein n=2 Tax=Bacteria TaxID=2 RepID=UPI00146ADCC5
MNNLLEVVIGERWPTGSESGMWEHADRWADLVAALDAAIDGLVKEKGKVADVASGAFADGLRDNLQIFVDNLRLMRDAADGVRVATKNGGAELQETKIMLGVQLALLLIQLAWLFASLFGALAVPVVVAGFRVIIWAILRQIFIEVAQELAEEPLLKLLIQVGQNGSGKREGIDWEGIAKAAIVSSVAAAFSGFANFGVDMFARWAARKWARIDRVGLDGTVFITDWKFRAPTMIGKGLGQGGAEVPGEMLGQLAAGLPVNANPFTFTSGFIGGLYENNAAGKDDLLSGLNRPSLNGFDQAIPLTSNDPTNHQHHNTDKTHNTDTDTDAKPSHDHTDTLSDTDTLIGDDDTTTTHTSNTDNNPDNWDTETLTDQPTHHTAPQPDTTTADTTNHPDTAANTNTNRTANNASNTTSTASDTDNATNTTDNTA